MRPLTPALKRVRGLSCGFAVALFVAGVSPVSAGGARITILNTNGPGVGFNDPTPATPVGGNTGTTLATL